VNCKLGDEFGDLNEWKFVTLKPKPGECVDDEIHACMDDALQVIEAQMIPKLKSQRYAAINCDDEQSDGYYLVQWEGQPFVLQESMKVEGCKDEMPEGTTVCEGRYLHRVPRNPHWFQHLTYKMDPKKLFRVQYVLNPDIELEKYTRTNKPTAGSLTSQQERMAPSRCYKVPQNVVKAIAIEKLQRKALDYIEIEWDEDNEEAKEEEEEEENEKEENEEED
jgi:hypothetical protein